MRRRWRRWLGVGAVLSIAGACGDAGTGDTGQTTGSPTGATDSPAATTEAAVSVTDEPDDTTETASMPTTDGDETTATPTTTPPAETTGTMDVDCDADDYLLPFVASSPVFTADSASLVVHIEDDQGPRIVRMSLCGDVEETLVTGVDVIFPELALPPANDRLYFTAGGDMPGLSSIAYPGGGPVTLHVEGTFIDSLAVAPNQASLLYRDSDAFRLDLPMGVPMLLPFDPTPTQFAFAPDGHAVAFQQYMNGGSDLGLFIWDLTDDSVAFIVNVDQFGIRPNPWLADSRRVAYMYSFEADKLIRTFDTTTNEIADLRAVEFTTGHFAVSPDEAWIVATEQASALRVYRL